MQYAEAPMRAPWDVKLDRAEEHLQTLAREIRQLLDSGDIGAVTDSTGRERSVRLVIKSEIPPRLSAIVGDIIHNTRSALDCLALTVCEVGNGGPLKEAEEADVQFPIIRSATRFDQCVTRVKRPVLPHARQEDIELIRWKQPLYDIDQIDLDAAAREESIEHDQLTTVQRLSNIDKHRRLHLTAWYPTDIYAGTPEGVEVNWRPGSGDWTDGGVVGHWLLNGTDAETVEFHAHASVKLGLRHHLDLGWHDIEVDDFLSGLVGYVRSWVVVPIAAQIGQ